MECSLGGGSEGFFGVLFPRYCRTEKVVFVVCHFYVEQCEREERRGGEGLLASVQYTKVTTLAIGKIKDTERRGETRRAEGGEEEVGRVTLNCSLVVTHQHQHKHQHKHQPSQPNPDSPVWLQSADGGIATTSGASGASTSSRRQRSPRTSSP